MSNRTIVLAIALAALSACGSGKSSSTASSAPNEMSTAAATPNCNGESPVWALPGPKVYLVPGDRLYGKTKAGQYLCLSQAQAEGYRHGRRPFHHHKHGDSLFQG